GALRLRRDLDDRLDEEGTARRDLLEVPPVLHRQAEARRLRRPHRPLPEEVRQEGGVMRLAWTRTAKAFVGTFNALTNGLTASDATTADRNVDMLIGGQAVIEGVMMRSLTGYSVAVRQADGGVAIKQDKLVSLAKKYPFLKFPVLRGSVMLIQSLILGMRALNYSANVSMPPQEGAEEQQKEMSNWAI